MTRDLNKQRSHLEHLFILIVFGDFLGIPVLPPYYTLRLLPYVAPNITGWKRSMLRERDLTDLCDQNYLSGRCERSEAFTPGRDSFDKGSPALLSGRPQ
jgi:hypothetical protein